jgi:hypothetical protein
MAKYTNISNLKVIFYEGSFLRVVPANETIECNLIPAEVAQYFVEVNDKKVSLPEDVFVIVEDQQDKPKKRGKRDSEEN